MRFKMNSAGYFVFWAPEYYGVILEDIQDNEQISEFS